MCVAFFQENCTYAKIPGTCFMGKTDVELYMKVEKNVYQLGDEIPVHIECTVKGSSKVDRVGTLYLLLVNGCCWENSKCLFCS